VAVCNPKANGHQTTNGHDQDAPEVQRKGQSDSVAQEIPDGRLDKRAQSGSRPGAEDLDAILGFGDSQGVRGCRENQPVTSEEVKAPGRHRVSTGLLAGSHRAGNEDRTQSEAVWTVSLPDHPANIVERHYRRNLSEWLAGAVERNARELEQAELSINACPGGYRSACWRLAGELRGHPLFAEATGAEVASYLDKLINWAELPGYDCCYTEMDPRDSLIDAIDLQEETGIRPLYPALTPVNALELAERHPLVGPDVVGRYPRAVSLMYWYQHLLCQAGEFFLAVETVGKLLVCSSRTSGLYFQRARREDLIEMIQDANRPRRLARQWKWIGKVEIRVVGVTHHDSDEKD